MHQLGPNVSCRRSVLMLPSPRWVVVGQTLTGVNSLMLLTGLLRLIRCTYLKQRKGAYFKYLPCCRWHAGVYNHIVIKPAKQTLLFQASTSQERQVEMLWENAVCHSLHHNEKCYIFPVFQYSFDHRNKKLHFPPSVCVFSTLLLLLKEMLSFNFKTPPPPHQKGK